MRPVTTLHLIRLCVALALAISVGACSGDSVPSAYEGATSRPDDAELYAKRAASLADEYGIQNPPAVEMVRPVKPDEDTQIHAQCMDDSGWSSKRHPDGSVEYDYSTQQEEQFFQDLYVCQVQYPTEAKYLGGLESDQWSKMYDHYVNVFVPCAEREGFDVGEIPSRDTYLAQPDAEKWFPGRAIRQTITSGSSERFQDVEAFEAICPPTPEWEDLYE